MQGTGGNRSSDPVSTFILKTTVMSASFEGKSTDRSSIQGKDALIERLMQMETARKVPSKDAADARAVITDVDVLQVITSKDVMKILSCQTTKARLFLKMMEGNGLIKTIRGKGKGKYILDVSE